MPLLLPGEHLLSAICRGLKLGIADSWQGLVEKAQLERGDLCPGHTLRPLYAATAVQYESLSVQEIISDHSLWKYFRSFIPSQPEEAPPIEQWGSLYNHRSVLYPLRQVRYRHAKQWRWCLTCNQEAFKHFGTCYWHTVHQVPGASHCPHHPKEPLRTACSSCGHQINDISEPTIQLLPENRCPSCKSPMEEIEHAPEHPFIGWAIDTSQRLYAGERFNTSLAYTHIFEELGFQPDMPNTVDQSKRVSEARKRVESALPLKVINWFFQTQARAQYQAGDTISPLCLRLLYKQDTFIHPLTWLAITWIVLSDSTDINQYVMPWKEVINEE